MSKVSGVDISKKALALHKKLCGKLRVVSAMPIKTREELSLLYTPGVAAVSKHVAAVPQDARYYTGKGRMIAVVSDGSAVLGLGNIGPYGALPVMEGKCALFKTFADVDAVPLVLDTQDIDAIVETIVAIAPAFGGINLEDIAAPKCFEIERRLKERLDIPVIHDDQHGTAVAILAALINAAKVVKKKLVSMRVVILGAGAAGTATAKLLLKAGISSVVVVDSRGVIHTGRYDLSAHKEELARLTNPEKITGEFEDAIIGADVLVGVSGPNLVSAHHISKMSARAIVFAMANPVPEIMPEEAKMGGALVVGTGRSDFANQINNSLVFPGMFRGALRSGIKDVTDDMKVRAAKNLAGLVKNPTPGKIIPGPFEKGVASAVARAIS